MRYGILIFCVVLLAVAVIGGWFFSPPPVTGKKLQTPVSLDLGILDKGQKITKTFEVRNVGSKPVTIRNVFGTCGCAKVTIDRGRIAPRDHATVEVTFDASGFWLNINKYVYIYSDDDTRPLIAIPLEAYVKVGVQLNSRTVYLGSGHFGDMLPSQHTRLLRDPAGRQPTVTFPRFPSEVTITGDAWAKYEEVEVYPIKIQALPLNRPQEPMGPSWTCWRMDKRFPLHLSYTIAPMMTCDPLSATLRWESSGVFPHASIKLRWPRSEQVVLEETGSLYGKCTARAALSIADEGMLVMEAKTGVQPDDFDVLIVSYCIRDGKRFEQIYIPVSLIN